MPKTILFSLLFICAAILCYAQYYRKEKYSDVSRPRPQHILVGYGEPFEPIRKNVPKYEIEGLDAYYSGTS
jgi:hypothetical protein